MIRRGRVEADAEIDVQAVCQSSAIARAAGVTGSPSPGPGAVARRLSRDAGHRSSIGTRVLMMASTACLLAGVGLAAQAPRFGVRAALAETLAGGLLILGLVLIGFGLPVFRS